MLESWTGMGEAAAATRILEGSPVAVYQGRGDRGSLSRVSQFKAHGPQRQKSCVVLDSAPELLQRLKWGCDIPETLYFYQGMWQGFRIQAF